MTISSYLSMAYCCRSRVVSERQVHDGMCDSCLCPVESEKYRGMFLEDCIQTQPIPLDCKQELCCWVSCARFSRFFLSVAAAAAAAVASHSPQTQNITPHLLTINAKQNAAQEPQSRTNDMQISNSETVVVCVNEVRRPPG